ncbi:transcriptional regulator FilR1 domain-containing protein [Halorubrum sp. FL23]|uniref:transcriptional regulator FilR1 domain-containing protein n=1 Tax=Halorubrum sp. FL23 TaxID=3458704 RepID=UPI004033199B
MANADTPGAALRRLVAEAAGVDADALRDDAEIAERGDDPGPAARLPALAGAGGSIVGVVPRADPGLARQLLNDGEVTSGTLRLVLTGGAEARLTGASAPLLRSVLAERGVETYRHDGDSPVAVFLVGDRAVVGLFDERGLAALLWSDAPPVREWAAATCRRYLSAADPV